MEKKTFVTLEQVEEMVKKYPTPLVYASYSSFKLQ